MKKGIVFMLLFLFFNCKSNSGNIENISVEELKNKLNTTIQLVDVRTPKEWQEGVIKGAKKININSNDFEKKALATLDKSKPVYIYCRSGGRSLMACDILLKKGYTVYNIEGGYKEWKQKIDK